MEERMVHLDADEYENLVWKSVACDMFFEAVSQSFTETFCGKPSFRTDELIISVFKVIYPEVYKRICENLTKEKEHE